MFVSNTFALDPEKSLPNRKSCDRSGCTMMSISNDMVVLLSPLKWMKSVVMPLISCFSPVQDIMEMGCWGCRRCMGVSFANLLRVDVRIIDCAHLLSYRAVIGSRFCFVAASVVLMSMLMWTSLGSLVGVRVIARNCSVLVPEQVLGMQLIFM